MCPCKAIDFTYNAWGEGKASIDVTKCKNCGLCKPICPSEFISFNAPAKTVYAVLSKENRDTGSSGGVFYELASKFITQGGIVYGAAFDANLKLVHKKARNAEDLLALCKSKYLHSDMAGIYSEISGLLKENNKVMFVGTPCQVSAVKNLFYEKYKENLLLVDFLCHGTGTQKVFDICINEEQRKKKGKIIKFMFRAKTRKAEHSFKYTIEKDKTCKDVSGYSYEFPYYYSFLQYNIFNEYCYDCKYSINSRVGDITLGDFWGIQKYNDALNDKEGVSMISVNSEKGKTYFDKVRSDCLVYEYPLKYASDNNQAFNENDDAKCRASKHVLEKILLNDGAGALMARLSCPDLFKRRLYAKTPRFVKKIRSRMRGIK